MSKAEELMNLLSEFMPQVDETEMREVLACVGSYIDYCKRLMDLSPEEKIDFMYCMEGYPLTDKQRLLLDENPGKREYIIERWARSTYFRRCAWMSYLNGVAKDKPTLHHSTQPL